MSIVDESLWAASLEHYYLDLDDACSRGYCLTAKQYNKPSPPERGNASALHPLELCADAQPAKS